MGVADDVEPPTLPLSSVAAAGCVPPFMITVRSVTSWPVVGASPWPCHRVQRAACARALVFVVERGGDGDGEWSWDLSSLVESDRKL